MTDLNFYERVLPSPNKTKNLMIKLALIVLYIVFSATWILSSVLKGSNPGLIILVISLVSVILFCSLTFFNVEYEYCISDTYISLAKIYNKRRRKEIFSADSNSILFIAPKTDANLRRAEEYHSKEVYDFAPEASENRIWIMVFEGDDEENFTFIFETEDYVTKILKQLKPSAMTMR